MQADHVEDLDLGTAFDDQSLDDVDAVQFDLGVGQIRQIPASGGGGRRVLLRPSRTPRRERMRLMVRTDGTLATLWANNACRMASAPIAPWSSPGRTAGPAERARQQTDRPTAEPNAGQWGFPGVET